VAEVSRLLPDCEVLELEEMNARKPDAAGQVKSWHIITEIAQKRRDKLCKQRGIDTKPLHHRNDRRIRWIRGQRDKIAFISRHFGKPAFFPIGLCFFDAFPGARNKVPPDLTFFAERLSAENQDAGCCRSCKAQVLSRMTDKQRLVGDSFIINR